MRPGIAPFVPDEPWQNCHENFKHHFARNASWQLNHEGTGLSPKALYKRATENLQWAIGDAIDHNRTLRAIGAGWSLSPVAVCNGGMVQTKGLDLIFNLNDRYITPAYHATGKPVSGLKLVECGVQISRLNKELEINATPPRCIRASGGSNGQTVAGATSTGTHGAALFTGAVHDAIVGIHLITGRDTHVWLERASYPVASDAMIEWLGATPLRDDELFNAALVSFGSFGIIHGVMLETEPLFLLKEYRINDFTYSDELLQTLSTLDIAALKALLPEMPDSVPGHELYHMEINMNPYAVEKDKSGGMYIFLFYKVPVPPGFQVDQSGANSGPSPEFMWMMKGLLSALGGNFGYNMIKKKTTQEFEKNVRKAIPYPKTIGSIFRATRFTGNVASFALAVATSDLPRALEQIQQEIGMNAFAGAVAVRFVKGTKATLGFTCFEKTSVIELDGLDIAGNHKVFSNVILRLINEGIIYTLHWGKQWNKLSSPQQEQDQVVNMYGEERVQSWKRSREALLTPEVRDVFTNDFMIRWGLHTPLTA